MEPAGFPPAGFYAAVCAVVAPLALGCRALLDKAVRRREPAQDWGGRSVRMALLFAGGLLGGGLLLALTTLPGLLAGRFDPATPGFEEYLPMPGADDWSAGALGAYLLLAALAEELLFRGLGVLGLAALLAWCWRLAGASGRAAAAQSGEVRIPARLELYCLLAAALTTGCAFGFAHGTNEHFTPLSMLNIALAGIWLALVLIRWRSLAAAWGAHSGWNIAQALLGLPVSGYRFLPHSAAAPLHGAVSGPLTGGSFGSEGSAVCAVALALALALLLLPLLRGARPAPSPPPGQPVGGG